MGKLAGIKKALDTVKRNRLEAYHGTPHEVDKFSSENIGTGEGAQAYGHGLYFAENKGVAQEYQRELSRRVDIDGKPFVRGNSVGAQVGSTGNKIADDLLIANNGDIEAAILDQKTWLMDDYSKSKNFRQDTFDEEKLALDRLEELKNNNSVSLSESGNLYKVELDIDPDTEMLDWDLPLSESAFSNTQAYQDVLQALQKADSEGKVFIPKALKENPDLIADNLSGNELYALIEKGYGKDGASGVFGNAGIKGIRYDDGFSRGKDTPGTKNFVVFDDNLISIAEKNGIPMSQVDELAQSNGISKQQALASLIGGSTGVALMGGPERAEAGVLKPLTKTVKIKDLITNPDGVGTANSSKMWGSGEKYEFDESPVDAAQLPNGELYLLNGYHRRMNALDSGIDSLDVKVHPMDDYLTERVGKEMPNLLSQKGQSTTKNLTGLAAGSTLGTAGHAFLQRRAKQGSPRAIDAIAKQMVGTQEVLQTVGSAVANDMLLSAGALGTQFMHNLAEGFERQGAESAESFVRPEQTQKEFYEENTLPQYMPKTEEGINQAVGLGNVIDETVDYWKDKPLGKAVQYGADKLGQATEFASDKLDLDEEDKQSLGNLSNLIF